MYIQTCSSKLMYFKGMHAYLRDVDIIEMEQLITVFIHTFYGLEGRAIIIVFLWPAEILVASIEC